MSGALCVVLLGVGLEAPRADATTASSIVEVRVSIRRQRATLINSRGATVSVLRVSTGLRSTTPRGTFRVQSKSRRTRSVNGDYTMEFMVRFSGRFGFHSVPRFKGKLVSAPLGVRPSSHGCVRLAKSDAQRIFQDVPIGTRVVVVS